MKKNWKHINFEQRKVIASMVVHSAKLKEIGEYTSLDPTSISKELKRNRILVNSKVFTSKRCKKLDRYPYVCNACSYRYSLCGFKKYVYKAKEAQDKANENLVISRRGIDLNDKEYKKIDESIKQGLKDSKSIYHIVKEDNLPKSVTTIYRYINSGFLTTKRMNLPLAVTYKKRKHNKKYEYRENLKIDRSNHTYLNYLSFINNNPRTFGWQLDFLGSIKTDSKAILSLVIPELQFVLIKLINKPDSNKVVKYFDELEDKLKTDDFKRLFPFILTDRDPSFNDIDGICFSKITGEERCKLFFCDPYVSNQKPNIENINKQLRKFFPKGKSIDKYTNTDIKFINRRLHKTILLSLDGHTPKEAFITVYGEDIYNKLMK